jgi:DNA helicase HerA-like ATPase
MTEHLIIARNATTECVLQLDKANRHGLITGATGTGKTVTLQVMAEQLFGRRRAGLHGRRQRRPDRHLAGRQAPRRETGQGLTERLRLERRSSSAFPVTLWDVFGEQGHPVRATVSDLGPLLLSAHAQPERDPGGRAAPGVQAGRRRGLLLLDMKDLRAMCQFVGDNAKDFTTEYGNISAASIGAIQRGADASRRTGRRQVLWRAHAQHRRLHADRWRARAWSTSWRPTS